VLRRLALFIVLAAALRAPALADDYVLDPNHTQAVFSAVHLGFSHVSGQIPVTGGTIAVGAAQIPTAISATLNAAALDSKSADRDNQLRGPDWFDVSQFPTITFVSTRVDGTAPGGFTITGNLTMHGVTKPVTLAAKLEGQMTDQRGRTHVAYSATTTVDRRQWGMDWGKTTPGGSLIAGNDVTITITVEAVSK
jgi:polyisoprenoid-binding protein YceI